MTRIINTTLAASTNVADHFAIATHNGEITVHNTKTGGHRTFAIKTARRGGLKGKRILSVLVNGTDVSVTELHLVMDSSPALRRASAAASTTATRAPAGAATAPSPTPTPSSAESAPCAAPARTSGSWSRAEARRDVLFLPSILWSKTMSLPTPADILDMADPAYLEELTTRLLRAGYGQGRHQSSEEVEILVSPGFGAGWVTWHHGSRGEQLPAPSNENVACDRSSGSAA